MLPTMVRCRVRSTHSSATCPSSTTAIRDSCLVELMTISRDIRGRSVIHHPPGPRSSVVFGQMAPSNPEDRGPRTGRGVGGHGLNLRDARFGAGACLDGAWARCYFP